MIAAEEFLGGISAIAYHSALRTTKHPLPRAWIRKMPFWIVSLVLHFLPIASDRPRPSSARAELLKYWAMWSGNMIGDSGAIKGVALWMTGSALLPVIMEIETEVPKLHAPCLLLVERKGQSKHCVLNNLNVEIHYGKLQSRFLHRAL